MRILVALALPLIGATASAQITQNSATVGGGEAVIGGANNSGSGGFTPSIPNCILVSGTTSCLLISGTTTNALLVQ